MKPTKYKRLTVEISPVLHAAFKAACAKEFVSMSQAIISLIERRVAKEAK